MATVVICLLAESVARPGFADQVTTLVGRVTSAQTLPVMHEAYCAAADALGAQRSLFVNCEPGGNGSVNYQVQSAGQTDWGRTYLDEALFENDPWMAHARRHSDPVVASRTCTGNRARQARPVMQAVQAVQAQATAAGFVSTLLVPTHAPMRPKCFGFLVLGHAQPGWFDAAEQLPQLCVCARALAVALQDWWLAKSRRDRLALTPMSDLELELLALHRRGATSEDMARALGTSKSSVNSRFQRLNARLGHRNRGQAAQWAADCGFITD